MSLTHIMRPDRFKELLEVAGCARWNGKTYLEDICIFFANKLTDAQKNTIREMTDEMKALKYVASITPYTHHS